jgi:hypothetical protein
VPSVDYINAPAHTATANRDDMIFVCGGVVVCPKHAACSTTTATAIIRPCAGFTTSATATTADYKHFDIAGSCN